METKRCGWCKREKPVTDFYKRTDRPARRSRCRTCEAAIARGQHRPHDPDNPYLPVSPFVSWLDDAVDRYGVAEASHRIGLSQRRIYAFLQGEQVRVTLDTVDGALVNEGTSHLSELYPELYEMEEAA